MNTSSSKTHNTDTDEVYINNDLEIYYVLDLNTYENKRMLKSRESCDTDIVEHMNLTDQLLKKYIDVYFKTKLPNKNVVNITQISDIEEDKDVIRRGISTFLKMFETLKLKTKNETWFVYISIGNIKKMFEDVLVVLINKEPSDYKCLYCVNTDSVNIYNTNNKTEKLNQLKILTETITKCLEDTNILTYNP
jgi:hypothetical protein